ncbi:MAG: NUDIX domain-containing protein [Candidatus Staskawiczbacteria bacterium]|nr:NUDIX domain-containing protein [Candidatus Staskawiczbacteria bacterium]
MHKLIPLPCVEVIITKPNSSEFLLTFRNDKWWHGWHIPGSYIRIGESIQEACNRVAKNEVKINGVTGIQLIAIKKWQGSPYGGNPISTVIVCYPIGEVQESESVRFFSSIPTPIIKNHAEFLAEFIKFLEQRNAAILT